MRVRREVVRDGADVARREAVTTGAAVKLIECRSDRRGGTVVAEHAECEGEDRTRARYAPHTAFGFRAPGNKTLLLLANLATANSYGADFNGQLRFGKLSGFVGVTAYQQVTDGSNVQSGLGTSAMSWSARGSLNFKLSPSTDVQWFQFYRAAQKMEQGRMGAMQMAIRGLQLPERSDEAIRELRAASSVRAPPVWR